MREIAEAEVVMFGEVFQRFVEKSPITMMVRGVLERVLGAEALDAWYEQTAQKQYTRTLLFCNFSIRRGVQGLGAACC
jgi:hypothetical protein